MRCSEPILSRFGLVAILLLLFAFPAEGQQARQMKQHVIDAHQLHAAADVDALRVGSRMMLWRESNDALARRPELAGLRGMSIERILDYDALASTTPDFRVSWDTDNGMPIYIGGNPLLRSRAMLRSTPRIHDLTVREFFRMYSGLTGVDAHGEELLLHDAWTDEIGRTHLRYKQFRDGVPIYAKEAICGVRPNGDMDMFMGRLAPSSIPMRGAFRIDEGAALQAAEQRVGTSMHKQSISIPGFDASPLIQRSWLEIDNELRAVFVVELRTSISERWLCFVAADDASILRCFNTVCSDGPQKADATDLHGETRTIDTYLHQNTYYLIDASRAMFDARSVFPGNALGVIQTFNAGNTDLSTVNYVTSSDNTWPIAASVSAHYHAGLVYEYFRDTHGRNSIDGKGASMTSVVNVTHGGRSMENAFWNGYFVSYGNGGTYFEPLAKALDIVAHEFTHGVTEHTAGLEYFRESGALNEAFSDIFAVMIDRSNWTIAEDVTLVSDQFPSGALRNLADPHNDATPDLAGWQPKHMDEYVDLPDHVDNGGVHVNSGIPNHAVYYLAEQLGREMTEAIMYRTLTTKLTRQARFIDFRLGMMQAARELYDESVALVCAEACDYVGIFDGQATDKPVDYPPVDGIDRMLFVNTDPFLPAPLWIATPPASSHDHFSSVSFTEVWSRPSISDDGTVAVFIDDEFNIRAISLEGAPNEQILDNSEIWNSIALNRDITLIALTTLLPLPQIYVIDISGPTPVARSFDVYTPTYTDSDIPNTARFVDAMEFSLDNSKLLFDTYNQIDVGGFSYAFWDINIMDIWNPGTSNFGSGRVERVFPQDPSINLGNPTWAKTKPAVIAFDAMLYDDDESWVMAMNILDGQFRFVSELPFGTLGYPCYSGNDRILSYNYMDVIEIIYNVPMEADAITRSGAPQGFIPSAIYPLWFRTGSRPVSTERLAAIPTTTSLEQNYPNPFNPSTTIAYSIPHRSHVMLSIHDALGRLVAVLADETQEAGTHARVWNGLDLKGRSVASGVYFYRLNSGDASLTRRMLLAK